MDRYINYTDKWQFEVTCGLLSRDSIHVDNLWSVVTWQETKVTSPDYTDMDKEKAAADFTKRIQHYENMYEPLDEEHDKEYSYIRIYNQGERFLVNRVRGECFHPPCKSVIWLCWYRCEGGDFGFHFFACFLAMKYSILYGPVGFVS